MTAIDAGVIERTEHHLLLSPHYDDIALSAGGAVALVAAAGRTPQVALIFGDYPDPGQPLTSFAESLHEQWGLDAAEVIDSRRREETAAAAILGSDDTYLPFKDAIYRDAHYTSDPELFGEIVPEERGLASQIVATLSLPTTPDDNWLIYAPLAIGGHVDHQHAFEAGVQLARAGWQVLFYEDLPYALIEGKAAERLNQLSPRMEIAGAVDVTTVWDRKIAAIMAYPSQLGVIFGGYVGAGSTRPEIDAAMRAYSEAVGDGAASERFWRIG